MQVHMTVEGKDGSSTADILIADLVIAGWAGRDKAAMEHHITELEALGIARPKSTPTFYRVSASRLTTSGEIEASGADSSGEAETVLFASNGRLFVGLGSDHTDRKVEAYGVTVSKQMCDKPIAATVWPFSEVADHWDQLILRSFATISGARKLYQEGPVAGLLSPDDLIAKLTGGGKLPDGTALFGGTLPAIGGIQIGTRFECELEDPVLSRKITLGYEVKSLAIAG